MFDSLAALLVQRPELLVSSAFVEPRELREPREPRELREPDGASVRASVLAARAARAIEVHDIALDEWGAMEAGTTYVRGMRDGGTWGGGVEIAAAAPRVVPPPSWSTTAVVFGPVGAGSPNDSNGPYGPDGPYGPNDSNGPYGPYGPAGSVRPLGLRYTGSHYTPVF
jgi:hypothetical protein